jgi:PleD family two-component response regulator
MRENLDTISIDMPLLFLFLFRAHTFQTIVIAQESKGLLKNRILIVDDEPDIAQVLKMGLEENGFAVDAHIMAP